MKTRKELKSEYKNMKFRMGVFLIVNKINGKIYIGSSPDLIAAWNSQRFQLEAGLHSCASLQSDWKTFGQENFTYEIVEEIKQSDDTPKDYSKDLKALEELIIEELDPFGENGYNKRK
ncbi:MAG: GIY-YIG nuclease family protein [Lentimicrobium sp.]|jgi:group I intron endonuclease|nr:GIY-YIG nuclease family protein [Lentimicrobium sp.]